MAVRLRHHLLPRLLAVIVGLAGLLAMHGIGPPHAVMAVAQMASAPLSDSAMAGPQAWLEGHDDGGMSVWEASTESPLPAASGRLRDGVGAASAAVSSVSTAWAATAVGVLGEPGMPGWCVAVLGASVLLLTRARLRAAARLGPLGRVAPSAHPVGRAWARLPSSLSAPSAAELCVWRT